MHALSLLLALAAAEATVPAPSPVPEAVAPAAVTPLVAPALVSAPPPAGPPSAPAPVVPADVTPAQPAAAAPSGPAATPAAAEPPSPPRPPPPLSQGAVEKLGQGDRAFLERDYRNALFAYQDAVYLAPRSPVARVKLGRAYLALRYASRAIEQAELALAADPASAEARRLLEEAKNPPPRPPAAAPPAPPASAPATAAATAAGGAAPASARVYRFTPEAEPQPEPAPQPSPSAAEARGVPEPASAPGVAGAPAFAAAEGARTVAVTAVEGAQDPAPAPAAAAARPARQRYREALALLERRDFARADEALTDAIAIDPRLAVAHAARASARFGLGRYREASTDYRAALALDPGLGTPLYGLAECYRVLGDARSAAEMYERYARSGAADVRGDLREIAAKRAQELR